MINIYLYRFVNDSPWPNAKMKCLMINGQPALCLFALKTIESQDEIVYDYGADNLWWRSKVIILLYYPTCAKHVCSILSAYQICSKESTYTLCQR